MNADQWHTCTVWSRREEFVKWACKTSYNKKCCYSCKEPTGFCWEWWWHGEQHSPSSYRPNGWDLRLRRQRKSRSLAGLWMWEGSRASPVMKQALIGQADGQGFSSLVRLVNDQPRPPRQWPVTDRLRICSPTNWSISRRTRMYLRNIKVNNEFSSSVWWIKWVEFCLITLSLP